MKRILIPYFFAGIGHYTVAQAIAFYLNRKRPSWEIRLLEPGIELEADNLNQFYKEAWKQVLKMPSFASQFLFWLDGILPWISIMVNRQNFEPAVPKTVSFINEYNPDLIMSTHWGCSHLFSSALNQIGSKIPHLYLYGELGGAHKVFNCGADIYFTLSDEASGDLIRKGIEPQKIKNVNLIVRPQLLGQKLENRDVRTALNLANDDFLVVLSLGGEGIGLSTTFISEFIRKTKNARMLILTGKNRDFFNALKKEFNSEKVIIYDYQECVDPILAASDVFVGKCGTSYVMEAVKTGKPFIAIHIGAPNENHNRKYLTDRGYGWYTPRPKQFTGLINRLSSDKKELLRVKNNLDRVATINGAEEIAYYIIKILER